MEEILGEMSSWLDVVRRLVSRASTRTACVTQPGRDAAGLHGKGTAELGLQVAEG